MKEQRRDRESSKRKGLRDEGVKGALRRSVSVNLAELSPSPRLRRTRWRVLEIKHGRLGITAPTKFEVEQPFMKGGGSRPAV